MKQLVILIWLCLLPLSISAQQFSWPPRKYPMSVPCKVSNEVRYYWGDPEVVCIGKGNGGYKFRISGIARHDFEKSMSIDMFYIVPHNRIQIAGSYLYPQVTKGQKYSFEIVSAFTGYTPSNFEGFFVHDKWLSIPEEESRQDNSAEGADGVKQSATTDRSDSGNKEEKETVSAPVKKGPTRGPSFVGGESAMKKFFADNAHPRKPAIATAGYGEVIVEFTVTETGDIIGAKWKGRVSVSMDEEALRLVKMMPKWNPGLVDGEPAKMKVQVGLRFFPNQEFRFIKAMMY